MDRELYIGVDVSKKTLDLLIMMVKPLIGRMLILR